MAIQRDKEMNIENLKRIGKEWDDGRIYFNLVELFPGLVVNYSDTGSVNSAALNGEPLDIASWR